MPKEDPLNATDVLGWLREQQLQYASRQAYGVRLRLTYWPGSKAWEVTLASDVKFTGENVNNAIKCFNDLAGL